MTEDFLRLVDTFLAERGGRLPLVQFSDDALRILQKRYFVYRGTRQETPVELLARVALGVQAHRLDYKADNESVFYQAERYFTMMADLDFLPNSPTLMNAGKERGQLAACFLIPVEDSMSSIMQAVTDVVTIHKSGGGTGMDFSRLRPEGSMVNSTHGVSSGPVSFMRIFDTATDVVKQGGTRRGANMGVLRVDHPDIMKFIDAKADNVSFSNFNLSVGITEAFMEALEGRGASIISEDGAYDYEMTDGSYRDARGVWDAIITNAANTGDPGIVFLDKINEKSPFKPGTGHEIRGTNPCGEVPLENYEACNLGSINLVNFCNHDSFDYPRLAEVTRLAVEFMNDVIDSCTYPLPQIDAKVKENRKLGLGVMGWADCLIKLSTRYGSKESLDLAEKVMRNINTVAHDYSCHLAQNGFDSFPSHRDSKYNRPMRNATLTCIAPTGTLSMLAGVSSGIEPVFALAQTKTVMDGMPFLSVHPGVKECGLTEDQKESLLESGHLPESIAPKFPWLVSAHDVPLEEHIAMQAAFQKHTDNAVSKTININKGATKVDVDKAYRLAYTSDLKGITIFVDGCKGEQVYTSGTEAKKNEPKVEVETEHPVVKKRPKVLWAAKTHTQTGCGKLWVDISDEDGMPVEVFCRLGKNGGCANSFLETIGRVTSIALRAGVDPEDIIEQMRGMGCPSPCFGEGGKVLSCTDAVGRELERYIRGDYFEDEVTKVSVSKVSQKVGACPECGSGDIEYVGGCPTCKSCGWSKCG